MATWRRILQPELSKSDLSEEIEADLALAIADKCERGIDPETARREAECEFGNVALVKDVTREMWGWIWLEQIQQDIKSALHQICRSPGFAVAVITILAVGIGAATAMFTVVDCVLLRPPPFANPDRLVSVQQAGESGNTELGATYADLQRWQKHSHSFEQLAYYLAGGKGNFLDGNNGSSEVTLTHVSPNLFRTLGVSPRLGHDFDASNDLSVSAINASALILSDVAWRHLYGSDPNIVGKTVRLNGTVHTVVGVMPQGFTFSQDTATNKPQVWTALKLSTSDKSRNGWTPSYRVVARLADGISPSVAKAELGTLQQKILKGNANPEPHKTRGQISVSTFGDFKENTSLKRALMTLLLASGIFWLIACVNVTNLLLARSLVRYREIAMRVALGAGRWRLVQQAVIEGLVLSMSAAVMGAAFAVITIQALRSQIMSHLPIQASFGIDIRVLAALIGLTLFTALLSSGVPAIWTTHMPIGAALKQGGQQSGSSHRHNHLRSALVIVEIGISVMLLLACGLLLRSINSLRHVPLGFDTDHLIVANLTIPSFHYAGGNMTKELYEPLLAEVQHLPGVQAAGLMSQVPLGRSFNMILTLLPNADTHSTTRKQVTVHFKAVTPSIQRILGLQLLKGRFFSEEDRVDSKPVVIVNRAFVRAYFADQSDLQNILGKQLSISITRDRRAQIVGILDDERQSSLAEPSQPEVEVCISQITPESGFYKQSEGMGMDLVIRTTRSLANLAPDLRPLLGRANAELANATLTTMDQVVEDSYGDQRFATHLLEVFGGLALLLCIGGIYGLLAYVVTQRTRDIGLRIALGASRHHVLWLILRQAISLVLAGICLGAVLSFMFGYLLRSYLYEVSTHDLWTLTSVGLLFIAIGIVASYLPARRAARIDPVEALRAE